MRKIHYVGKFEIEEFDSHIYLAKNIICDDFCDLMTEIIENSFTKYSTYGKSMNVNCFYKFWECEYKEDSDEMKKKIKYAKNVFDKIYLKSILFLITKLSGIFDYNIPKHSGLVLRKIIGPTRMHTDGPTGDPNFPAREMRVLTCIIGLNNNYQGGIWNFPNQNVNLHVKKGDVLFFPPYWQHSHSVQEPFINPRYTITTWFLDEKSESGYEIT
jgi:hypothetical protein